MPSNLPNIEQCQAKHAAQKAVFLLQSESDYMAINDIGLTGTWCEIGKFKTAERDALKAGQVYIIPQNTAKAAKHAALIKRMLPQSIIVNLPVARGAGIVEWLKTHTKQDLIDACKTARDTPEPEPTPPPAVQELPFRFLGYNRGLHYFLPNATKQVISYSATSLKTRQIYFELANLNFWQTRFGSEDGAINWTGLSAWIIEESQKAGLYVDTKLRGRGAWIDRGRTVMHAGETLRVDGVTYPLHGFDSDYIYEIGATMGASAAPISAELATRVYDACKLINFRHPIMAQMLAGWIAIAPICGVLKWRPHIWIVGQKGTGKSWIIEEMVTKLMGGVSMLLLSITTESGIRQKMGTDAIPVIFDEAEGNEDEFSRMRVQRILELIRSASSEGDAVIAKGSASGHGRSDKIRSCFCFGSVASGLRNSADESRVTVLDLVMRRDQGAFAVLQDAVSKITTPEYANGLVARSLRLVQSIRRNAETFALAITARHGSRRAGDQIGALLAGWWSLTCDDIASYNEAVEYVATLDLRTILEHEDISDESRCIDYLFAQRLRVDLAGHMVEQTIGELVEVAANDDDLLPTESAASRALKRYGLAVTRHSISVAVAHSGLAELLRGTPWSLNWAVFLLRLPGATRARNPVRFAGGAKVRAVVIPLKSITDRATELTAESVEN